MAGQPNLLVLLSDQHNAAVLGAAGDPVVRTPHLDGLAAAGTRFDATYCPYPLCAPARVGFLTGQHPLDVGVHDNGSWLPGDVPTFAHGLRAGGYETVLCGRMHLNGPDQLHGFERRLHGDVTGGAAGHWLTPATRGGGSHMTTGQTRLAAQVAGHGRSGYQAFDASVTQRACRFLQARAAGRARPWCLVVGFILPHNPLICRRSWFEPYLHALPEPAPVNADALAGMNPAIAAWRRRRGVDEMTPRQRHRARAAYYGLVSELDENVGLVLEALARSGLDDDTVVVYASDHGDMADEQQGMWWKSCYFDGAARVPLILRGPGIAAGSRVGAVTGLIDVAPTLLDLAGVPALPVQEGRSLASALRDAGGGGAAVDTDQRDLFLAYAGAHGDAPSAAIRRGRWKLMLYPEFDTCLLFDLVADPQERRDRSTDPECAAVVADLRARIEARWSGPAMARAVEADHARRRWLAAQGLVPAPNAWHRDRPKPEDNVFDATQLPAAVRAELSGEGSPT